MGFFAWSYDIQFGILFLLFFPLVPTATAQSDDVVGLVNEIKDAWRRLGSFSCEFRHMSVNGKTNSYLIGRIEVSTDGSLVCISRSVDEREYDGFLRDNQPISLMDRNEVRILIRNRDYSAFVMRKAGEPHLEDLDERDLRGENWDQLPLAHFGMFDNSLPIWSILKMPEQAVPGHNFEIIIQKSDSGGKEAKKVFLTNSNGEGLALTFVDGLQRNWEIIFGGKVIGERLFEYHPAPWREYLKRDRMVLPGDRIFETEFRNYEKPLRISSRRFFLSHYGIPEPPTSHQMRNHWFYWVVAVGLVATVAFFLSKKVRSR